MKKLYSFSLPLIGMMLFSLTTVIASDQEFRVIVEEILNQRTSIMQSIIDGDLIYEEGAKALAEAESVPLLEQDLRNVAGWKDTCYERIRDFQIRRCQLISENEIGAVLWVDVLWNMYDREGEYQLFRNYLLVLEKGNSEGQWKLCEMILRS